MSATLGVRRADLQAPSEAAEQTSRLYERYGQRVFTFCFSRLRDREDAQDAVQTTFVYAMRSLQRGVVPEFELAWLLKIAFNVCRSTRRSLNRQPASSDYDISELPDPLAATTAEGHARLDALHDALATLPESQRRGILMREWQGLSYAEIAEELGISVSAVETLLFRARRNLTTRLEGIRGTFGALDLGSMLAFLRSLLPGTAAKAGAVALGVSIALVPIVGHDGVQAAIVQADAVVPAPPVAPGGHHRGLLHQTRSHARVRPARLVATPRAESLPPVAGVPTRRHEPAEPAETPALPASEPQAERAAAPAATAAPAQTPTLPPAPLGLDAAPPPPLPALPETKVVPALDLNPPLDRVTLP